MVSRIIAGGGLALAALLVQPANAAPLAFGPAAQSGGGHMQPVFHERPYRILRAPVYVEPRMELLSSRQIERLLRRSGYSRVEVVALDGPIYTVQGLDPWDNFVEMKIFGTDGRVLRSDVIEARLYETPLAELPPVAIPDEEPPIVRAIPQLPPEEPPMVGAIPQSPPGMVTETEPRIAAAPLPRDRPAYRPEPSMATANPPEPSLPDPDAGAPADEPGVSDRQASERDPLVVY